MRFCFSARVLSSGLTCHSFSFVLCFVFLSISRGAGGGGSRGQGGDTRWRWVHRFWLICSNRRQQQSRALGRGVLRVRTRAILSTIRRFGFPKAGIVLVGGRESYCFEATHCADLVRSWTLNWRLQSLRRSLSLSCLFLFSSNLGSFREVEGEGAGRCGYPVLWRGI